MYKHVGRLVADRAVCRNARVRPSDLHKRRCTDCLPVLHPVPSAGRFGAVQPSLLRECAIACDANRARDEESRDASVESGSIRAQVHRIGSFDGCGDRNFSTLGRGWRARGQPPRPAGRPDTNGRLAARQSGSGADDARAVFPGGRWRRRLTRVRAAHSGRSSAVRAGHRIPREQPARPSCQYPRRRDSCFATARRARPRARIRRHHRAVGRLPGRTFSWMDARPGGSTASERTRVEISAQ